MYLSQSKWLLVTCYEHLNHEHFATHINDNVIHCLVVVAAGVK